MDYINFSTDKATAIAAAADFTLKPWKHSVVQTNLETQSQDFDENKFELIMRIECRDLEGRRFESHDLELEIFSSGNDVNLMLSSCGSLDEPILWQGKHSVWIDSQTGKRCNTPPYGSTHESLARRVRALFDN